MTWNLQDACNSTARYHRYTSCWYISSALLEYSSSFILCTSSRLEEEIPLLHTGNWIGFIHSKFLIAFLVPCGLIATIKILHCIGWSNGTVCISFFSNCMYIMYPVLTLLPQELADSFNGLSYNETFFFYLK